jgi:hypothetical protein
MKPRPASLDNRGGRGLWLTLADDPIRLLQAGYWYGGTMATNGAGSRIFGAVFVVVGLIFVLIGMLVGISGTSVLASSVLLALGTGGVFLGAKLFKSGERAFEKDIPPEVSTSREDEERDRGRNYRERSQAYVDAVSLYARLKDHARGTEMSDFMRMSLFINMQKKTPSEILTICEKVRAAVARGEADMKSFIRELEATDLGIGEISKPSGAASVTPSVPPPAPSAGAAGLATGALFPLAEANQFLRYRAGSEAKLDAQASLMDTLLRRPDAPAMKAALLKSADPDDEFPFLIVKSGTRDVVAAMRSYFEFDAIFTGLFGDQPFSIVWADRVAENCPGPGETVTPLGRERYAQIAKAIQEGGYRVVRHLGVQA